MTDLDALYHAVLARPDDDTPRLVYADALDDLGAADRASFVRNQVEAARSAPWEPAAIRVRCFRGDAPPGTDWLAELPALPDGLKWAVPPFRRGFPATVEARDGAAFVAAADRLFDLAPVESLELAAARAADVAALAACPGLARLKRLVIREGLGQAFAHVLLNSPHLGGLEELVIGAGLTSARTARAVVGSRAFRGLGAFSYRDEERGGAMASALAALAAPPPLRALDLQGNRLSADGLRRLTRSPLADGLEALDIGDNHLGPDGFREFDAGVLPRLRRLDAMRTYPTTAGFAALVHAPFVGHLAWLNLGGNALGSAALGRAGGHGLRHLRVLDLRDNQLGDAGARLLADAALENLLHLDLAENRITAAGANALADAPWAGRVIALGLGGNSLPAPARTMLRERFGNRVLL